MATLYAWPVSGFPGRHLYPGGAGAGKTGVAGLRRSREVAARSLAPARPVKLSCLHRHVVIMLPIDQGFVLVQASAANLP
jgi:hypothetical protein